MKSIATPPADRRPGDGASCRLRLNPGSVARGVERHPQRARDSLRHLDRLALRFQCALEERVGRRTSGISPWFCSYAMAKLIHQHTSTEQRIRRARHKWGPDQPLFQNSWTRIAGRAARGRAAKTDSPRRRSRVHDFGRPVPGHRSDYGEDEVTAGPGWLLCIMV